MDRVAGFLVFGLFMAAFLSSQFVRVWLSKRYQAGTISGRRAGWLYAAAAGGPYLVLFGFLAIGDPSTIWLSLLVGFVIFGVQIVPWVATFRYPEDERRKRQP
jgi:hypothetical protein